MLKAAPPLHKALGPRYDLTRAAEPQSQRHESRSRECGLKCNPLIIPRAQNNAINTNAFQIGSPRSKECPRPIRHDAIQRAYKRKKNVWVTKSSNKQTTLVFHSAAICSA